MRRPLLGLVVFLASLLPAHALTGWGGDVNTGDGGPLVESVRAELAAIVKAPEAERGKLIAAFLAKTGVEKIEAVFIEHSLRLRAEMEDAFERSNTRKIERIAHTLKGSSSVLAARPVMEAALALERVARDGNLEASKAAWVRLGLELDLLLPVLASLLRGLP